MHEGVAPLPLLAKQRMALGRRTASACRSGLPTFGASRDLVHLRLGQSSGHGNRKQRYSESLRHGLLLPRYRKWTSVENIIRGCALAA